MACDTADRWGYRHAHGHANANGPGIDVGKRHGLGQKQEHQMLEAGIGHLYI